MMSRAASMQATLLNCFNGCLKKTYDVLEKIEVSSTPFCRILLLLLYFFLSYPCSTLLSFFYIQLILLLIWYIFLSSPCTFLRNKVLSHPIGIVKKNNGNTYYMIIDIPNFFQKFFQIKLKFHFCRPRKLSYLSRNWRLKICS